MDNVKEKELEQLWNTALMSIDGLKEIQEAEKDIAEWEREEFEQGIAEEHKALRPKPERDVGQMKLKHPRAAAFLNAMKIIVKVEELYSDFMAASLGNLKSIISDDDYYADLNDMKEDLKVLISEAQYELRK